MTNTNFFNSTFSLTVDRSPPEIKLLSNCSSGNENETTLASSGCLVIIGDERFHNTGRVVNGMNNVQGMKS